MLRIAIIEDDKKDCMRLESMIKRYSIEENEVFQIQTFSDAESFLEGYKPVYDIVFMDIMLGVGGMNGLAAAKKMRTYDENVTLIFTTTMIQFAIEGYEVNAMDYMVKPVDYYKVRLRLERVRRNRHDNDVYINVALDGGQMRLSAKDIFYIEVISHNLYFYTKKGDYKTRGTMGFAEKILAPAGFARSGISYLVNLAFFRGIKGNVLLIGDYELRLTRGRQKEFLTRLSDYLEGEQKI